MSITNENHIKRQWQIIQFLIGQGNYTSSDDVLRHLQNLGFDVKERTVQRDLNALANIFPLECRKDDKPYSWRWQRVAGSKKNKMSYEQALIFMLMDNELRDMLPDDLLQRLQPLFVKAKMVMAGVDYQKREMSAPDRKTTLPGSHLYNRRKNAIPPGPPKKFFAITGKLNGLFRKDKLGVMLGFYDDGVDKDSLLALKSELEKFGLSEFVVEVEKFIQLNRL